MAVQGRGCAPRDGAGGWHVWCPCRLPLPLACPIWTNGSRRRCLINLCSGGRPQPSCQRRCPTPSRGSGWAGGGLWGCVCAVLSLTPSIFCLRRICCTQTLADLCPTLPGLDLPHSIPSRMWGQGTLPGGLLQQGLGSFGVLCSPQGWDWKVLSHLGVSQAQDRVSLTSQLSARDGAEHEGPLRGGVGGRI